MHVCVSMESAHRVLMQQTVNIADGHLAHSGDNIGIQCEDRAYNIIKVALSAMMVVHIWCASGFSDGAYA